MSTMLNMKVLSLRYKCNVIMKSSIIYDAWGKTHPVLSTARVAYYRQHDEHSVTEFLLTFMRTGNKYLLFSIVDRYVTLKSIILILEEKYWKKNYQCAMQ